MSEDAEMASASGERCSMCGAPVASSEMIRFGDTLVCIACKPLMLQAMREGVPDDAFRLGQGNAELASFVGPRALFYLRKFERLAGRPGKLSWNWPAFCLTSSWMIYRKMYGLAALFLLFELVQTLVENLVEVPEAISWSFYILFAMGVGLWGNHFYQRHAERTLAELASRSLTPEQHALEVARQGGVNLRIALIVSIAFAAVSLALSWWFHPEDFPWSASDR